MKFEDIDPWILTFSAVTVAATIAMGFWSAKKSKTASDYFVAGRSVSVGWNASAISGEYLSAASFMGIAGMVMKNGYDALWYPVCYACGYLFLLLFIAGPLRRFGAYTIPDFAEGRYDSPLFRRIAVIFVLFIGFFYTMPQMKGAGTTLAYIFPGLDYRWGVILVGAVITLNVALGGMKGITLVQAVQYWIKMFAISVPIFVLMAVYGGYGSQLERNGMARLRIPDGLPPAGYMELFNSPPGTNLFTLHTPMAFFGPSPQWKLELMSFIGLQNYRRLHLKGFEAEGIGANTNPSARVELHFFVQQYGNIKGKVAIVAAGTRELRTSVPWPAQKTIYGAECLRLYERVLRENGFVKFQETDKQVIFAQTNILIPIENSPPAQAPAGPPITNLIAVSTRLSMPAVDGWVTIAAPPVVDRLEQRVEHFLGRGQTAYMVSNAKMVGVLMEYAQFSGRAVIAHTNIGLTRMLGAFSFDRTNWSAVVSHYEEFLTTNGVALVPDGSAMRAMTPEMVAEWRAQNTSVERKPLPAKAPKDEDWLRPFGPLTTKAAKTANASPQWNNGPEIRATLVNPFGTEALGGFERFMSGLEDFVQGIAKKKTNKPYASQFDSLTNMPANQSYRMADFPMLSTLREYGQLAERPVLVATNLPRPRVTIEGSFHSRDDLLKYLETVFLTNGVRIVQEKGAIRALASADWKRYRNDASTVTFVPLRTFAMHADVPPGILAMEYADLMDKTALMPRNLSTNHVDFNPKFEVMLAHEAIAAMDKTFADAGFTLIPASQKEVWLVPTVDLARYQLPPVNERAYSLLYTYSLIIALVCGTAGLPHILVRFYTNPDGVAAKRTTMWVMILIGAFYLFPPVFGVLGRNLLPELYSAVGAKGTDKVVLELPSLLNQKVPGLGSVLSGITCAGAFAAFMSTFSGLLVSMTGALAHDVYGRILRPKSTPQQRLRAFKVSAVGIGFVAIVLGMQVEKLDINFMVGQAFAIAAASYFPLLFLSTWWRGMTMKGAACGMLGGGLMALGGITLTSFSDLKWIHWDDVWTAHPLWRILCEQPAIWAVPLAIGLMIVVSKLTRRDVPADVRMKMLVLHAPEKLGLKQEYIQEHQGH